MCQISWQWLQVQHNISLAIAVDSSTVEITKLTDLLINFI